MATKVYDPDQIAITLGGITPQGFQDGSMITITMNGDSFTHVVGTDGEVSRSKNMDRSATITLSLMQTSGSNILLSALSNTDRNAPGGAGIVDLFVRDMQGLTLYQAAEAWISKEPDVDFAKEAGPRAWTIVAANLIRVDAGG